MRLFFYAFFKEFLGNFGLGIAIFSLFFFFGESSKLFETALFVSGDSTILFARSLGYLYAQFWQTVSVFVLPMALLLGMTLSVGRPQQDRELLAIESLGVPIQRWVFGFLSVLGILFSAGLYPLVHKIAPEAKLALKQFVYKGKDQARNLKVEPKTWIDLGTTQLFAENVKGSNLKNVVLYSSYESGRGKPDQPTYKIVGQTASYKLTSQDPKNTQLFLRISQGSLEYPELAKPGNVTVCSFETYENAITLNSIEMPQPDLDEQSSSRLRRIIHSSKDAKVEFESRQTLALSPLTLSMVCALLALSLGRYGKGLGFGLALAILGAYWMTLVLFVSIYQPWATNPSFLALGTVLARWVKRK